MAKEKRVIEVDAATMETFLATYSADRITEPKGARLKGVVDFEGKLYTCVGSVSAGEEPPTECLMVEVIPKLLWEHTSFTYADKSAAVEADEDKRESFYRGIRVTYKRKEYVLGDNCKAIWEGSRPAVEPVRVKREKYTAMARYDFQEKDLQGMAKDIARTVGLLGSLEGEKKTLVSEYAAKINKAQAEINELARMLNAGYEFRMIEHEREYDFNAMVVYVTRLDTFEVTETRAMTGQEAQMDIGFREEEDHTVYEGGSTEEGEAPGTEVDDEAELQGMAKDHAEGAEAEEPLGAGQEVPEAESTLGMSSAFPTEYEDEETTEGGEDIDRD
jgi:hypothetical protein